MRKTLTATLALTIAAGVFCVSPVVRADDAPAPKHKHDPEAMFKKMDADSDGKVTLAEYKTAHKAHKNQDQSTVDTKSEETFKKIDTNNDGSLSLEEFKAYAATLHKSKDAAPAPAPAK